MAYCSTLDNSKPLLLSERKTRMGLARSIPDSKKERKTKTGMFSSVGRI
jgi:hypothetical protein